MNAMIRTTLAATLLTLIAAPALAADSMPIPEKAQTCIACHGADGIATQDIYPHLAGQYASYLEHALREYRAGLRKNPVMTPMAAALSDDDIRKLAAYYAAQRSPLYAPSIPKTP